MSIMKHSQPRRTTSLKQSHHRNSLKRSRQQPASSSSFVFNNDRLMRLQQHYSCSLRPPPSPSAIFSDDLRPDILVAELPRPRHYQQVMVDFLNRMGLWQVRDYDTPLARRSALASVADVMRCFANTALVILRYHTLHCAELSVTAVALAFRLVFSQEHSECTYTKRYHSEYMTHVLRQTASLLVDFTPDEIMSNMLSLQRLMQWRLCGPLHPSFCDRLLQLLDAMCGRSGAPLAYMRSDTFLGGVQMLALYVVVALPQLFAHQDIMDLVLAVFVLENSWPVDPKHPSNIDFGLECLVALRQHWTELHEQLLKDLTRLLVDEAWRFARRTQQRPYFEQIMYDAVDLERIPHLVLRSTSPLNFMTFCRLLVQSHFFALEVEDSLSTAPKLQTSLLADEMLDDDNFQ